MEDDFDGIPDDITTNIDCSSSDDEKGFKTIQPRKRSFNSPVLSFSDSGSDDEDEPMDVDPLVQEKPMSTQVNGNGTSDSKINGTNGKDNQEKPLVSPRSEISPRRSPSHSTSSSTSPPNSPPQKSPEKRRDRSRSPRRYSTDRRQSRRSPVRRRSDSPLSPYDKRSSKRRSRSPTKKSYHRRSPSPIRRGYRSTDRRRDRSASRSPKRRNHSRSKSPAVEKIHDKFAHFRNRRSRSRSYEDSKKYDYGRKDNDEKKWTKIRNDREKYGARGIPNVWGRSPTESDLIDIYKEHEKAAKVQKDEQRKMEETERKRQKAREKAAKKKQINERIGLVDKSSESEASSSDSEDRKKKKKRKEKKKKHKKEKKSKKHKKQKRKRRHSSSSEADSSEEEKKKKKKTARKSGNASESENEWVPLTKNMIAEEQQRAKEEEAEIIGPTVPEHLIKKDDTQAEWDFKNDSSIKKDMLRGEAESMAAYYAQGKRIPRRGEIGLSSEEISTFEKAGYVMSGTRHKAMEATRLRKENQIMTAEEKRMLSGFTHEQRKQKEDVVLQRMRTLIDSKKSKE